MSDQPEATWVPPKPPSPEELRSDAHEVLARIDEDREIVRLIGEGWSDEQIGEHLSVDPKDCAYFRRQLAKGEEIRPIKPYELGLRRYVGQLSTEDMMTQLRTWPYTFGQHHWDVYDGGTWDEVRRLRLGRFISIEEYRELRAIAEQLPGWTRH